MNDTLHFTMNYALSYALSQTLPLGLAWLAGGRLARYHFLRWPVVDCAPCDCQYAVGLVASRWLAAAHGHHSGRILFCIGRTMAALAGVLAGIPHGTRAGDLLDAPVCANIEGPSCILALMK